MSGGAKPKRTSRSASLLRKSCKMRAAAAFASLLFCFLSDTASCSVEKRFEAIESGQRLDFSRWRAKCKERGGRLANINSPAEQKKMQATVKSRKRALMTGMKRIAPHAYFVNGSCHNLSFANWYRKEPNDASRGDGEECLFVNTRSWKWFDARCSRDGALCEFIASDESGSQTQCTKRFKLLTVSSSSSASTLNFAQWIIACEAKGGRLANINSGAEQTMALAWMKTSAHYALTGMRRIAPHALFVNSNGHKLPYTNWRRGQPNDLRPGEECVALQIRPWLGKWDDVKCNARAALCEFYAPVGLGRLFRMQRTHDNTEQAGSISGLASVWRVTPQRTKPFVVTDLVARYTQMEILYFITTKFGVGAMFPLDFSEIPIPRYTARGTDINNKAVLWGNTFVQKNIRFESYNAGYRLLRLNERHCLTSLSVDLFATYVRSSQLFAVGEEVSRDMWSSWSRWSFFAASMSDRRSRVCCGSCSGAAEETRGSEFIDEECWPLSNATQRVLRESGSSAPMRLEKAVHVNGSCVFAFASRLMEFESLDQICRRMGMVLYSMMDPLFTKEVISKLKKKTENKELTEDFITGILRTEDAFTNVMDRKEFALSDIADGTNVIYKGRGGSVYRAFFKEGIFFDNYIENCVFLRHSKEEDRAFLFTDLCRASEFICHAVNMSRNEIALRTEFLTPSHCVSDHFGLSYRGNLSKSISGSSCLPWTNFKAFFFMPNIEVGKGILKQWWIEWNKKNPHLSYQQTYQHETMWKAWYTILTKKRLLPAGFLTSGNECRNSMAWPFFVADAVCVVPSPLDVMLEACAPPLCAKNRGRRRSLRAPTRTATVDFICSGDSKGWLTFFTFGMARHARILGKSVETAKTCFDINYGGYIFQAVLYTSFALSIFILIFMWRQGLWKSNKYSTLIYLNFMNIFLVLGFSLFLFYTVSKVRVQWTGICIVKLQVLSMSLQMYFLAVICVGVDCAIAVLYPLEHHTIASKKLFIGINVSVFMTLFITQLVAPLTHVAISKSQEKLHCESHVFQKLRNYFLGNQIFSVIQLLTACGVNITIAVGVIRSLIKRKKLLSSKEDVVQKTFKLVSRLLSLLAGNYG